MSTAKTKTTTKERQIIVEKRQQVDELAKKFNDSSIAIITDYRGDKAGLGVKDSRVLRGRLRAEQTEYQVVKNTIARRATESTGLSVLHQYLEGPTAVAFGYGDPAATAKVLVEFAKEHKKRTSSEEGLPLVKVGVLDGKLLDARTIHALALLPPKPVVIGQFLGTLQAPISAVVNVLAAPMRDLANVLNAIKDKK